MTLHHDLGKHLMAVMQGLLANYRTTSAYGHRVGRGDSRENLIRDWLRSFLPRNLNVKKGEIVDHRGVRSPEFDIIIHLDSTAPQFFSTPERSVIPVEEVLAVIEVKTNLTRDALEEFSRNLQSVGELERRFLPAPLTSMLGTLRGDESAAVPPITVPASCPALVPLGVGPVMGMMFAYEGPTDETIDGYVDQGAFYRWFDFVYLLDRGFWAVHHPNIRSHNPFGVLLMAQRLLETVDHRDRWLTVRVDVERYMKSMFESAIRENRGEVPTSLEDDGKSQ